MNFFLLLASIGIVDLYRVSVIGYRLYLSPVNDYRLSPIRFSIISYRVSGIRFSVIVPSYVHTSPPTSIQHPLPPLQPLPHLVEPPPNCHHLHNICNLLLDLCSLLYNPHKPSLDVHSSKFFNLLFDLHIFSSTSITSLLTPTRTKIDVVYLDFSKEFVTFQVTPPPR